MNWKNEIKGIIFDLDGVIVDTAKYHYIAWKTLANQLGIDFGEEENENLKGVSRIDSLNYILDLGELYLSDSGKRKLAASKNLNYLELIKNLDETEILPGVLEWFDQCETHNIKIALGSASKNARRILDSVRLIDRFDVIIDGNNTTKTKPHPQVFNLAAKGLGFLPNQCVVIEDSLKGLIAAKNGNFHSIGIGDPSVLDNADINMRTMSEAGLEILAKLK